ncbi:nitroreductase family protein [Streptomyces sp. bgisy082]|uniref:nitroreductase family protein n=1 Tax=Streptomyces sp. bgisy082 TaxID=3413776 RepID=UPI003D751284
MTAVFTRRSASSLSEPAPNDEEFRYLLQGAATAPDHGQLRPWRWILVRGEQQRVLADCLAAESPDAAPEQIRRSVLRAPLKAVLVFAPRTGHKVPEWEQLAAASAMTQNLMLLLHSRGYGSKWRTGRLCTSPALAERLGPGAAERLLGALDVGTVEGAALPAGRRAPADVRAHLSVFAQDAG